MLNEITFGIKTFFRPKICNRLCKSIRRFYPKAYIIVADDSFKENEKKKKATKLADEYHFLPYNINVCNGRNFLVQQSKTKYYITLDDDFEFTKQTKINYLYTLINELDFDIVCGTYDTKTYVRKLKECLIEPDLKFYKSIDYYHVDFAPQFFIAETSFLLKYPWKAMLSKPKSEHHRFFKQFRDTDIKIAYCPSVYCYHDKAITKYYKKHRWTNLDVKSSGRA